MLCLSAHTARPSFGRSTCASCVDHSGLEGVSSSSAHSAGKFWDPALSGIRSQVDCSDPRTLGPYMNTGVEMASRRPSRLSPPHRRGSLGPQRLVIVPEGTWYRFDPPNEVKVMTVTPQPTDHSIEHRLTGWPESAAAGVDDAESIALQTASARPMRSIVSSTASMSPVRNVVFMQIMRNVFMPNIG